MADAGESSNAGNVGTAGDTNFFHTNLEDEAGRSGSGDLRDNETSFLNSDMISVLAEDAKEQIMGSQYLL